jgi:hypothetical protein
MRPATIIPEMANILGIDNFPLNQNFACDPTRVPVIL